MSDLAIRAVDALERIAAALEQLTGKESAGTVVEGWLAAPMLSASSRNPDRIFHAVRLDGVRLVTACPASGRRGDVNEVLVRALDQVPEWDRDTRRCQSSGCHGVFQRNPAATDAASRSHKVT